MSQARNTDPLRRTTEWGFAIAPIFIGLLLTGLFFFPITDVLLAIVGGSHGLIYLLSIVGMLLRPFSRLLLGFSVREPSSLPASIVMWCVRNLAVLLYPWMHLWTPSPSDIARTPFRPSKLLLIHSLWLFSSVGLWVGFILYLAVLALAYLFRNVLEIDPRTYDTNTHPAGTVVIFLYLAVFAAWSSWVWIRSLHRSRVHYESVTSVDKAGGRDDAGHYLSPFRNATVWAFATLPIMLGGAILALAAWDPG